MSTTTEERTQRRESAAHSLAGQSQRQDAPQIVTRLDDGLTLLRTRLYTRLQADVQRNFGVDSMLMPLAHDNTEQKAKDEIEAFLVAEVLDEWSQASGLSCPREWLLSWLFDLRLGENQDRSHIAGRSDFYGQLAPRQRHLEFSDVLERIVAEARRAPLILYQLFPLAVHVATALAIGDHVRAAEIRAKQLALLPSIGYCRACRGRLLEVDDTCRECGNPLWTIRWLLQAD